MAKPNRIQKQLPANHFSCPRAATELIITTLTPLKCNIGIFYCCALFRLIVHSSTNLQSLDLKPIVYEASG